MKLIPAKTIISGYTANNSWHSTEAERLWKLFRKECDSYNILYKMEDIIKAYKQGYEEIQLSLFD